MNPADLSDADLVQAVLGARDPACAHDVLKQCGGLRGLARGGSLAEVTSTWTSKRLSAAVELGRRCLAEAARAPNERVCDRAAVEAWAKPHLATLDHEELWVLALDGRHGLKEAQRVAQGGLHGLHLGPRDVFRPVLRAGAGAFVLVHCHPSGDPTPSDENIAFTKLVLKGCDAVGLTLLDHVIIARQRSSSMLERGLL